MFLKRPHFVFLLIAAAATAASTFPTHRYVSSRLLAYAIDAAVFLAIALLPRVARLRWAHSRWLLVAMLSVFFLEALFVHPIADARKLQGKGSDQDDALMQAATLLRHGEYPYKYRTYGGNPISDGPGWVILHTPVPSLRAFALETPVLLAFITWLLRRRSPASAFLFAAALFLMPIIHMLVSIGSDLLDLSAAIFLLCLTVYKTRGWTTALWVICCGLLITARVNLIVLPAAMLCFRTDWKTARAWLITLGSIALALLLHAVFYHLSPANYSPLHLVGKGTKFLSDAVPLSIVCGILIIALLLGSKAANAAEMAVLIGLFLLISHVPLAFGGLRWNFQHHLIWDGFEYISLCLVCLTAGAALLEEKAGRAAGRPA